MTGRGAMRGLRALCGVGAMAGLAACNDPAIDLGSNPPIPLSTRTVEVLAEGRAPTPPRAEVRDAIDRLGADPGAIDARVTTPRGRPMLAMRSELIGLGIDPSRITLASGSPVSIVLRATRAAPLPCETSLQRNDVGDVSNSIRALGYCVTANDLAQGLTNPGDLIHPVHLEAQDGQVAVRAVRLYRAGKVKQPTNEPSAGSEEGTSEGTGLLVSAGSPSGGDGGSSGGSDDGGAGASGGGGASGSASGTADAAQGSGGSSQGDAGAGGGAAGAGGNPLTSSSPLGPTAE